MGVRKYENILIKCDNLSNFIVFCGKAVCFLIVCRNLGRGVKLNRAKRQKKRRRRKEASFGGHRSGYDPGQLANCSQWRADARRNSVSPARSTAAWLRRSHRASGKVSRRCRDDSSPPFGRADLLRSRGARPTSVSPLDHARVRPGAGHLRCPLLALRAFSAPAAHDFFCACGARLFCARGT